STNDMVLLLSSRPLARGASAPPAQSSAFAAGLLEVCQDLAQEIAYDGEGATKLIEIRVTGAASDEAARKLALQVGNSPLVKTAVHGADPNWGRITQALGQAGIAFKPEKTSIKIMGVSVLKLGLPCAFERGRLSRSMKGDEILIEAHVGAGKGTAKVWTCDLTEEYIKINAEYN
ncbi:bifunctional ornithine acetyltransferase/N-acetylglutamate synthase, partial [Candidatus Sumerlaeota bacterium]|nr:bifunctional ornithine acetyltransferase/N-acetylglutamate synthase [Candidatus Sumerlaeota bacterium]